FNVVRTHRAIAGLSSRLQIDDAKGGPALVGHLGARRIKRSIGDRPVEHGCCIAAFDIELGDARSRPDKNPVLRSHDKGIGARREGQGNDTIPKISNIYRRIGDRLIWSRLRAPRLAAYRVRWWGW